MNRIYTYYSPSGTDIHDDRRLLQVWYDAWKAAGFEPVVLSEYHAQQHPLYEQRQTGFGVHRGFLAVAVAAKNQASAFLCDWNIFPNGQVKIPALKKLTSLRVAGGADVGSPKEFTRWVADLLAGREAHEGTQSMVIDFGVEGWRSKPMVCFNDPTGIAVIEPRWERIPELLKPLLVVFPFCNKDAAQMLANVQWMQALEGCQDYDCLLSMDHGIDRALAAKVKDAARDTFREVDLFLYPEPNAGTFVRSVAFVEAARHIERTIKHPFLWLEADAIPLRSGWLPALDDEYRLCGKRFFGAVVPDHGHMNGTGIYPSDTPARIPKAFDQAHRTAWDTAMRGEMMGDCFDTPLIQHAWSMAGGKLYPDGNHGEDQPDFTDAAMLNELRPDAVLFHRCKNTSLIEQLRARMKA